MKNVTVTGYVGGTGPVGGIVGYGNNASITGCTNAATVKGGSSTVGSIAIQDSSTGEYGASYLGGIVGRTLMPMEPSYISNCYSVGSLTYRGSASAAIRGIAGDVTLYAITNCYWLEGAAESGAGGYPSEASAAAKSKADFANGTVLVLLKGDRTDSPWADECRYVAAAGMTLPVFKGQTGDDAHTALWPTAASVSLLAAAALLLGKKKHLN